MEKKSGLHIKRNTDFKVGFFVVLFLSCYSWSYLLKIGVIAILTPQGERCHSKLNLLSRLTWPFRVFKVVCVVIRINVFNSNGRIHIYVLKIKI